jgi:hypothetical protein
MLRKVDYGGGHMSRIPFQGLSALVLVLTASGGMAQTTPIGFQSERKGFSLAKAKQEVF